jgi:4-alpha-glucanotransferase
MYVLQYELSADKPPATPPKECVASINTHDMPTFTSFWKGIDIEERTESGLLDESGSRGARANRERIRERLSDHLTVEGHMEASPRDDEEGRVLEAALDFLATSEAELILVNLEDLWQETVPQNVPGTSSGNNWRRKLRQDIAETFSLPVVVRCLRMMDQRRNARRKRV